MSDKWSEEFQLWKILPARCRPPHRTCPEAIVAPFLRLRIENYECCVTVFNSSVENRVEKARAAIENTREYGAYCSLHKSCASESQREGFCSEKGS